MRKGVHTALVSVWMPMYQGELSREVWMLLYSYIYVCTNSLRGGETEERHFMTTLLLSSGDRFWTQPQLTPVHWWTTDWAFLQQRNLGLFGAVPEGLQAIIWLQPGWSWTFSTFHPSLFYRVVWRKWQTGESCILPWVPWKKGRTEMNFIF